MKTVAAETFAAHLSAGQTPEPHSRLRKRWAISATTSEF